MRASQLQTHSTAGSTTRVLCYRFAARYFVYKRTAVQSFKTRRSNRFGVFGDEKLLFGYSQREIRNEIESAMLDVWALWFLS